MKRLISTLAIFTVVLGIALMSFGLIGAQDKKLKFIMVSHGGPGNPFWVTVIKGMNDAGATFGVDVQWLSANTDDIPAMPKYLDDAIAAKPDGLGITSPNPDIIKDGVTKIASGGTPVIIFNTNDPNANDPDKRLPALFYIGTSEFISGQSNARAALRAAKAAGATITGAVCPVQEVGHAALEDRCAGYADVMKQAGVTVDKITTDNDPNKNASILADYFKSHPQTNAINTLGPTPASAFYLYAKDAKVEAGKVFHTNHDTSAEIFENIKSGLTVQTVDQQPYYQGFGTIEWLFLHVKYGLTPGGDILTGPGYIDKTNVDQIAQLVKDGFR
jgi:simple sugar transport system substrate-binding protein